MWVGVEKMTWNEVGRLYPNQFVKLEILDSHMENDKKIIDDMAVVGAVEDNNATKELLNCKDNIIIYHTKNDNITLTIRKRIGLRRVL